MIPYSHSQEKSTVLHYAKLLSDDVKIGIINRDKLSNSQEAVYLANFYWNMVKKSNDVNKDSGGNSEYILGKIVITFMAYFRSAGYETEWDEVCDQY